MRLPRVLRMGFPELACRSRQIAWSGLGRVAARTSANLDVSKRVLGKLAAGPARAAVHARLREWDVHGAGRILLARFHEMGPDRFFAGAASQSTATILTELMPEAADRARDGADAVSQGRFDLLGYRNLYFGQPVDWRLDPISGRRAPVKHWSPLNAVDATEVGDCKVVWELNRHQWLVGLGQAYALTGDERYASLFAEHVGDWMRANPPSIGINWASSLEVALRLISWCWAVMLFRQSKALSPELFLDVLGGIWAHASYVERYLSYYFSPNTHLTGEALGLFYAGVVFPELRAAERWRSLGARILVEQSEQQVLTDGVYFEQATCYQRYTVEIYLHFLILAARNGIAVATTVHDRVQQMLDFLLAVRSPDGSMPQIGDADGGWLLPLATRTPDDLSGIFSTAAALFGRSDYAWAAGGPAPETLWLLGSAGLHAVDRLIPAPPRAPRSRAFVQGGYAVMRDEWTPGAHHLVFDVGPLGCPVSGGHGHADLLSIQCSVFGEPFLVDPGTYCYSVDTSWRNFFRSTAAHSAVMVDGTSQAVPGGPFTWLARPRGRLRRWRSTDVLDLADAEHDGYRHLADPVLHRRRVVFVKPRYWVIVDDVDGAAEHRVELRFQFAPIEVMLQSALWARAAGRGGHGLFIRPFTTVPLHAEVLAGQRAPIQGWVSPDYGRRQPAPVLVYSAVARLPLRIVTLLYPTRDPLASAPVVSPVVDGDDQPVGLVFEEREECVRFTDDDVVVDHR